MSNVAQANSASVFAANEDYNEAVAEVNSLIQGGDLSLVSLRKALKAQGISLQGDDLAYVYMTAAGADDYSISEQVELIQEYLKGKPTMPTQANQTHVPITKIGDYIGAIVGDGAGIAWNDVFTDPDDSIIPSTSTALIALCYRQKVNDEYRKEIEPPYADIALSDDEIIAAIRTVDVADYEGFDDETMRLSAWQDFDDARLQAINLADIKKHGPLAGRLRGAEYVPAISAQGTVNANLLTNKAHDVAAKLAGNNELPLVFENYYSAKITYKTTAGKLYNLLAGGDNPLLETEMLLAMPEPGSTAKSNKEAGLPADALYDRIVFTGGEKTTISFYTLILQDLSFGREAAQAVKDTTALYAAGMSHKRKMEMKAAKARLDSYRELLVKAVRIAKQIAAIKERKAQWRVAISDLLNTPMPVMIFDDEGLGKPDHDGGATYYTVEQLLRFEPAKAGLDADGKLSLKSLEATLKRIQKEEPIEYKDVPQFLLNLVAFDDFFDNHKKDMNAIAKDKAGGPAFVSRMRGTYERMGKWLREQSQ